MHKTKNTATSTKMWEIIEPVTAEFGISIKQLIKYYSKKIPSDSTLPVKIAQYEVERVREELGKKYVGDTDAQKLSLAFNRASNPFIRKYDLLIDETVSVLTDEDYYKLLQRDVAQIGITSIGDRKKIMYWAKMNQAFHKMQQIRD